MSNGTDLAAEVAAAIAEGAAAVGDGPLVAYIVRKGEQTGPDYEPTYGPDVAFECNAIISSSVQRHQSQTVIEVGDKNLFTSAPLVAPTIADRVQVQGQIYQIVNVMPLQTGGVDLAFDILIRGGVVDNNTYLAGTLLADINSGTATLLYPQTLGVPDLIDETDPASFYWGWEDVNGSWLIRKIDTSDSSYVVADQVGNSGYIDLTAAWVDRAALVYEASE